MMLVKVVECIVVELLLNMELELVMMFVEERVVMNCIVFWMLCYLFGL